MAFQGPNLQKANNSLKREAANKDRVIMLVAGAVATAEIALNTPKKILSIAQAEALLLNNSYDANNNILVFDHIKECFRLSPDAEIILNLTAIPTTQAEMVAWFAEDGIIDTALNQTVAEEVKTIFTAFNMAPGNFTNNGDGLSEEVIACIVPTQQLVDRQFTNNQRYIDNVILDPLYIKNVADLEDLRANDKANVQVVIASDAYHHDNFAKQAAIGAAMGMLTVRQINENLGSVEVINPPALYKGKENYPLNDGERFNDAYLVGTSIRVGDLDIPTQKQIAAKGYIFAGSFKGYEGFYFSGDQTCADIESDYAYGNHNSIWNKAARIVRNALIPKVRSVLKKTDDGYLTVTSASSLQLRGQDKLQEQMVTKELCSNAKVTIDREQTPNDQTPLIVNVKVLKDGILHDMDVEVGLTNSITN